MSRTTSRKRIDKNWKRQRNKVILAFFGVTMFLFLAVATAIMSQTQQDSRTQARGKRSGGPTYSQATFTCQDGSQETVSGDLCRSQSKWREQARDFCKGNCDVGADECGVDSVVFEGMCELVRSPIATSSGKLDFTRCNDTDNGRKIYDTGITSGPMWGKSKKIVSEEDYCIAEGRKTGRLAEFYCRSGKVASKSYRCRYGCSDGRCLKKDEAPSTPAPSNSPELTSTPQP